MSLNTQLSIFVSDISIIVNEFWENATKKSFSNLGSFGGILLKNYHKNMQHYHYGKFGTAVPSLKIQNTYSSGN